MSDYYINIFFIDEDGGYIADIPDLAYGSALTAWLEAAAAAGKPIPAPTYSPAVDRIA